jgi:cytochrome c oxidase assembly factor CtaG
VLMWAPGKLVHGLVVVVLAIAWLRATEARALAREGRAGAL